MNTHRSHPPSAATPSAAARLLSLLATLVWFTAPLFAQPSGTGSIRGQISNKATGANLDQALVKVIEISRESGSARDGTFEFKGLAPGTYTLVAEYPGLDRKQTVVTVEAGRDTRVDFALVSDIYILPALVVAGQREGNAAAIVDQRGAANVKNVLTADAFGDITKANLGNIMRRIPGVTGITDDEIDTSVIMVRGMEAYLTSVDIDGTRAASAFNGSRRQNVNALPAEVIEKIEVVKAPTAEDDADSLGGRVKLSTKSAFDLKERRIELRAGGSYNMTYGKNVTPDAKDYLAPSGVLTYSDVFGLFGQPNRLGLFGTASYERFLDARSNTDFPWVNAANRTPAIGEKDYTVFLNTSAELHKQTRKGGNLRFDYRAAEHTTLGLRLGFTRYLDDLVRSRNRFNGGTVDTALSNPDPLYTVVNNATYEAEKYLRLSTTDTFTLRANGLTKLPAVELSYDLVRSKANKFEFRNLAGFVSNRRFSYALDRRADPVYPHLPLLSGLDPFTDRFTDVASTSLEARRQAVDKDIWASRLDLTKNLKTPWPVKLQGGFRFREETQVQDQDRFVAAVASGVGRNLSGYLDNNWRAGGAVDRYPVGALPGFDRLLGSNVNFVGGPDPRTAWSFDPSVIALNANSTVQQSLLNDNRMTEELYATYLQGSVRLGQMTVLGGGRFERTDLLSKATVRNRGVTDPLAQFGGKVRSTASYDDFFPTLHLRYNLAADVLVRASFSNTIGRPDVDTVLANGDINVSGRSVTSGNPGLQPQYSRNYDLSLEYYLKPIGVLSLGAFQKDIRDYISAYSTSISTAQAAELGAPLTSTSPTEMTWTLSGSRNTGSAKVKGLEFNYSQQLAFLPGAFRGLGVFANYTWLQSSGQRQVGGTTPLQNFVPRSGSAGLSYTYGRWDARFQVSYNSAFLDNLDSSNRWRDQYKGERYQYDFNGKCRLTRRLALFANLGNLTSQNYAELRGNTSAARREGTTGYSFVATGGINVTF